MYSHFVKLCCICALFVCKPLVADQSVSSGSARQAALANAIITDNSSWSAFYNPAGLAGTKDIMLGVSYENRFLVSQLNTRSFSGCLPVTSGGFGVSYSYFGSTRYNEQKSSLGYAHKLGNKIQAGILFDYYTTRLPEQYETARAVAGEFGLIANPSEQLYIGFHIKNISNSKFLNYKYEPLPMSLNTGITWKTDNYLIGGTVFMQKGKSPDLNVGAEMLILKDFTLQAGISTYYTKQFTFGMGYTKKHWQANIAFAKHAVLGYSSYVSFSINIRRDK